MFEQLKQVFRSDYVRALEEDVARLRAENRALTNSLLGTAGFPPVEYPEAPRPQPLPRVRKRSLHQMQAWREIAANRESSDEFERSGIARTNGPVSHS
jgi:hypothetical protein